MYLLFLLGGSIGVTLRGRLGVRVGKSLTEHIESASPSKSGHEADMRDWPLGATSRQRGVALVILSILKNFICLFESAHGALGIKPAFAQCFRIPFAALSSKKIAAIDVDGAGQARNRVGH